MRENEFEKQVREKMEQLGFAPGESVWDGVDREIKNEKKRRIPLFWLFFVPGLLLAGSAYYFISNSNSSEIIRNKNSSNNIENKADQDRSIEKQGGQPEAPSTEARDNKLKTTVVQSAEPHKNSHEKDNLTRAKNNQQHFTAAPAENQKPVDHNRDGLSSGKNQAIVATKTKETNESGPGAAAAGTADIVINNYNNKSANTGVEKDPKKMIDSAAGIMLAGSKENQSKKDSAAGAATAKNKEQKKKSSAWSLGFTGGIGSSNLNQNLFNSVKTLSQVTYSTISVPPTTVNRNNSSSEISPGLSFQAGAFVSRNLSRRFSVSAGVNYHYYSTTMRTGGKINTTLVTTNSINQTIVADSYYENARSQTFTNQYHLIGIPVLVNFQWNKSKKTPFIWELGLTPAYILSSNALYYDPNTNVYFSNYLRPNKMQLNGVTALMFGFPMGKNQWQIGPQLQYGFTGFVNTNDGNAGHLFYAGLKISFIPGKK
ncbi:MAG TPA: outer membrane beta-barrel protein [Puia sp.]|jgi:hypothetical protein